MLLPLASFSGALCNVATNCDKLSEDIYNFPVCPVHLCDRGIYADAPALGKSAQEVDPQGGAADELERLYVFVVQHLKGVTHGKP